MNFVTIDFETANAEYNSACQIGLVEVSNGIIVDTYKSYICPPSLDFSPYNIDVHGITPEMVSDAPKFNEIWNDIKKYFKRNTIVIAHNATFDMSVLKSCLDEYDIKVPDFKYICSMDLSSVLRGECGKSLKSIADYFGYGFTHHDALDDAKACAFIVVSILDYCNIQSLSYFWQNQTFLNINYSSSIKVPTVRNSFKKWNKVNVTEIKPEVVDFDNCHAFYGKNIVFTGELKNLSRKDAMQAAINTGASLRTAVSKTTDFLIVGIQDKRIVGPDGLSTKQRKAYEMSSDGHHIQVLNESEFMRIIKGEN